MTTPPISLGYEPRSWQRQCHEAEARFLVLAVHRRAGKTEAAIMQLLDGALRCTQELPLFAYVCPFRSQAKAVAWARLLQKVAPLRQAGAVEVHEGDLLVRFKHNGAVLRLFGADNHEALRGLRLDGVVLDEVAWIAPTVWEDVLQPALSDRLGWAWFIGTPHGINLFSELWHDAQSLPSWAALRFTVHDTDGALDPAEVERLQREMPEGSFAREYLCDFSAAGDDQLIGLAEVEASARRACSPAEIAHAARVVGVDPARFGDDRTCIVQRQGRQMLPPIVLRGLDNMAVAARVADVIGSWLPDAVFIDSGAGAGVIDRLRHLGHNPIEVPFGGRANRPDQFVNMRIEMWWSLREWIRDGGAIVDDATLKQELATPRYEFDAAGRKKLEGKDDIKKRLKGGASPDIADALALTFAYPVAPRQPATGPHGRPLTPWERRQAVLDAARPQLPHDEFDMHPSARRRDREFGGEFGVVAP